ncbi:biopolymer transport protein ExbD/TolR [Roseivirga pacifica]|uniref:Biopolymer transport protein ExbD/TolR n=1 Tax=Roseivirga pacifica TaxID=1267423 RepID=A0A1I0RRX4_9BACT|nr:biopolymer transporter ExbD [Roseivirga pacifica]RKQ49447.1 biopolymer transport protein ExbD/TolR [Roseivirga pacifica]SEW44058.1 Biopolymer transport protein ExbD/TolR [Roseivirga pacifica]
MKSFLGALFSVLILSNCYSQTNEYVNCWKKAYQSDFNFLEELDNLERQLLSLKILKGTSEWDYKNLSEDLSNRKVDEQKLKQIPIPKFISKRPYLECNGQTYDPFKDKETLKYGLLFSLYLLRASEQAKIHIEVSENDQIRLNSKTISLTELKNELLKSLEELRQNEIPFDEIVISLEVAPEVKMGKVIDIQQIIRELNLKNILYSTSNVG